MQYFNGNSLLTATASCESVIFLPMLSVAGMTFQFRVVLGEAVSSLGRIHKICIKFKTFPLSKDVPCCASFTQKNWRTNDGTGAYGIGLVCKRQQEYL